MRTHRTISIVLAAAAIAMVGALATTAAEQTPQPKAYKPVAITLPQPVQDESFHAFRKLIVGIATRKDRAALAKHVARNFFWIAENKVLTDKSRSGIDNLSRAIDLNSPDSEGWDVLAAFASEAAADPDPQRKDVICAPGDPTFDLAAAEALAKLTGTSAASWFYPVADGLEPRGGMTADSAVIGRLGLHLVWVYPDDSPAAAVYADVVRIVLPSGKLGYVATDALAPLAADLLCYVKDGNRWTIAGVVGGDPSAAK